MGNNNGHNNTLETTRCGQVMPYGNILSEH